MTSRNRHCFGQNMPGHGLFQALARPDHELGGATLSASDVCAQRVGQFTRLQAVKDLRAELEVVPVVVEVEVAVPRLRPTGW